MDLFSTPFGPPVGNLAAHPGGWLARRAAAGLPPPGFTFVFAFQNPAAGGFPPAVLALYFTPAGGESLAQLLASPTTPAPQKAALARFLQAGPLERKTMVKARARREARAWQLCW